MQVTELRLPDLTKLGKITLTRWLVPDGAQVQAGDEVCEIESKKASVSIPSPTTGRLQRVADAGGLLQSGQLIARIHGP
jgi:pyruvate/2-oxoglutarate dehydrogenase complex dihydrolipoamide acyltransferase (E2) component